MLRQVEFKELRDRGYIDQTFKTGFMILPNILSGEKFFFWVLVRCILEKKRE